MGIKDRLAEYRWAVAQNIGDFRDSRVAAAIRLGLIMTLPTGIAAYFAFFGPEGNPRPTPTPPPLPGEGFVDPSLAGELNALSQNQSLIPPDQCATIGPGVPNAFRAVVDVIDPKSDLFDVDKLPRPTEQIQIMIYGSDGEIVYHGPLTGADLVQGGYTVCATGVTPPR